MKCLYYFFTRLALEIYSLTSLFSSTTAYETRWTSFCSVSVQTRITNQKSKLQAQSEIYSSILRESTNQTISVPLLSQRSVPSYNVKERELSAHPSHHPLLPIPFDPLVSLIQLLPQHLFLSLIPPIAQHTIPPLPRLSSSSQFLLFSFTD